jgi:hypothetical protein
MYVPTFLSTVASEQTCVASTVQQAPGSKPE